MSLKSDLICSICHLILKNPVSLPCFCVICDEHLYNGMVRRELITCQICGDEFNVPAEGFKTNKLAKSILDKGNHLSEDEKSIKTSIQEMYEEMGRLLHEFRVKRTSLEVTCASHFSEIRRKIDIHREVLKEKIDVIALKMIADTKAEEAKHTLKLIQYASKIGRDIRTFQ